MSTTSIVGDIIEEMENLVSGFEVYIDDWHKDGRTTVYIRYGDCVLPLNLCDTLANGVDLDEIRWDGEASSWVSLTYLTRQVDSVVDFAGKIIMHCYKIMELLQKLRNQQLDDYS